MRLGVRRVCRGLFLVRDPGPASRIFCGILWCPEGDLNRSTAADLGLQVLHRAYVSDGDSNPGYEHPHRWHCKMPSGSARSVQNPVPGSPPPRGYDDVAQQPPSYLACLYFNMQSIPWKEWLCSDGYVPPRKQKVDATRANSL